MSYADEQKAQEQERKDIVESYDLQVQEAQEERERAIALSSDEQKTVEKIAKKVQTLFYKIQCDQLLESGNKSGKGQAISSESRLAVLSGQGVSESNILHFMGLIEERAVHIIGDYVNTVAQNKSNGDEDKSRGRRPSISVPPKDPSEIRAVPTINDIVALSDEDDDDDVLKPADYAEYLKTSLSLNGTSKVGKKGRKKK